MRRVRIILSLLILAALGFWSAVGFADPIEPAADSAEQSRGPAPGRGGRPVVDDAPITPDRELVALKFAERHHDELSALLHTLRKSNNRYYQDALRELSHEAERIGKIADRDPDRYRLSLEIWKLDSRLRLEVARLSMAPAEEIESRLRPLLEARQAARLEILELDQSRATDRLEKLNEQLTAAKADNGERVTQELDRLRRTITSRTKSKTAPSKKSQKPASVQTTSATKRNP